VIAEVGYYYTDFPYSAKAFTNFCSAP